MTSAKTTTFKSGNSEAVRLPKGVAFGLGVQLDAVRTGDVVTLTPAGADRFAAMLTELDALPKPAKPMKRAKIVIPKRPGG